MNAWCGIDVTEQESANIPAPEATTEQPFRGNPDVGRRRFLTRLSIAMGSVAAVVVVVPVVAFLMKLRPTSRLWRDVGAVEQFDMGSTVQVTFADATSLPWSGVTAQTAAWLRRTTEREFVAFSVNCTHLGCPVRWLADANLFMCPCHGGVFYSSGDVASGPPPRPLTRYPVRVANGRVQVLASPTPIT